MKELMINTDMIMNFKGRQALSSNRLEKWLIVHLFKKHQIIGAKKDKNQELGLVSPLDF